MQALPSLAAAGDVRL